MLDEEQAPSGELGRGPRLEVAPALSEAAGQPVAGGPAVDHAERLAGRVVGFLDDGSRPLVPGGLTAAELTELLTALAPGATGVDVGVLDPDLDPTMVTPGC